MERRHLGKLAVGTLVASVILFLTYGVAAGLAQDQMRSRLSLFVAVLNTYYVMSFLPIQRRNVHFERLENRFRGDRPLQPVAGQRLVSWLSWFMVAYVAVCMSAAAVVGFQGKWFALEMCIVACWMGVIISGHTMNAIQISGRSKRLEELISACDATGE